MSVAAGLVEIRRGGDGLLNGVVGDVAVEAVGASRRRFAGHDVGR